jgi:AcrR family transcriptional regulator
MASTASSNSDPASPKGRRRRDEILDAAEGLLIREGYAGFSMRRIAEQLGIRLSNVQYYFATPPAVIEALFARALEAARTELQAGAGLDLENFLRYVAESQDSARSCHLFWELWALSAREPQIAQTLNRFYAGYCHAVESLIAQRAPAMPTAQRRRRAVLIMSMLEGLSLFRGHGRGFTASRAALDRELTSVVEALMDGGA